MKVWRRTLADAWRRASAEFPVLLLTGPRQVGKTTLLKAMCGPSRRYVTLDDPSLRMLASDDPGLFLQRFPPPVLIDEVQYAPALLPLIKMSVDAERRPGAFWLTGSQQLQMMKGITESLAGRVAIVNLLGFSEREAHRAPLDVPPFLPTPARISAHKTGSAHRKVADVYKAIWRGAYPALVTGQIRDRDLFLRSYVQTYLERDVRDLTQVGDVGSFLRFVRACAARTAQLLDLSELARDADISVPTAKRWLGILEGTWQVYLLRPYHTNATKRLVKTPKLYFLDTGLCSYLTEWSSAEALSVGAMAGALFETHVVIEIMKSWWHKMAEAPFYFYRDRDGREIDLLIAHDGTLYPVEIKRAATLRREWTAPFGALARLPVKVGMGAVVCLVAEPLPIDRTLSALPVGWL